MKTLLITPPFVQLNTPYPATPALAGFLSARGVAVRQADVSLAVALRLFSREGLAAVAATCVAHHVTTPSVQFFLSHQAEYVRCIDVIIRFLQGRDDAAGWLIARRDLVPEGPRFMTLAPTGTGMSVDDVLVEAFGDLGVTDRAKLIASLALDDLTDVIRDGVDASFGFSRYAERLAVSAVTFDALAERLNAPATLLDSYMDAAVEAILAEDSPDVVGITMPFPGTVYGAFRVASTVRRLLPRARIVLGGGYVNTELRELSDSRVFDTVDEIHYDEGFAPWLGTLGLGPRVRTATREMPADLTPSCDASCGEAFVAPSYAGLDLSQYINVLEMTNPMHRLWSDGKWIKLQVAKGCYWHACAFCDVALDYIGRYAPPDVTEVVAAMVRLKRETGQSGFHFTDEALAPALIRKLCSAMRASGETFTWWGNIRFDTAFTPALATEMAACGCIAVTGGLECANDRLLALMNKGITCASAEAVCAALSNAGILVHAYLMYGFPTETRAETIAALDFVRRLFAEGYVQSAYWHRFALTAHSPIARHPESFGIRLAAEDVVCTRFARNEIPYVEPHAPDHDALGRGLSLALYNYMLGLGLDLPVARWFRAQR